MRLARFFAASLLALGVAVGQTCTPGALTTTFAAGNGQNGNMFDVRADNPAGVTICSFDIHFQAAAAGGTVEVYAVTGGGSYAPVQANPAGWTLLGSATVTGAGAGAPTTVPLSLSYSIPGGATQGFYVTFSDGNIVGYTNGTAVGSVFASDSNITFFEGIGVPYPFAGAFTPRVFNGNINYCIGQGQTCPINPASPFQPNSPNSSLDIDGVQTNTIAPAVTTVCTGLPATVTAATALVGSPAEIVITPFLPLVAGPGLPAILTGSGSQVINVDILSAPPFFLFGGPAPFFAPHPGALVLPVVSPAPLSLSAQQVVIDPSNVDLIAISQGVTLEVSAGGGTAVHALTDDSFVNVVFASQPLCAGVTVPFYGTLYSDFNVISNGRVMFGNGDTDFSASVAEALGDNPFVGAWTDLNPSAGGTVSTNFAAGVLTVNYNAVPYFGTTTPVTFDVQFDTGSGLVSINNLTGLVAGGGPTFLGMSPGALGFATDAGASVFTTAGGSTANATDMIYEFGTAGGLAAGLTSILFVPNPFSNYDWLGL